MSTLFLVFTCVLVLFAPSDALTTRKVRVNYPTELLFPKTGSSFAANVTQDKLFCFGNDDYSTPTYRETLFCMLPYLPGTSSYCTSVWGSRTVEVEVTGSIEFLKVAKLPHETTSISNIALHREILLDSAYSLELSTTRWLQLHSGGRHFTLKKTLQIPAEPIYLCARSTDWQSRSATFSMKFRPAYLREKDKRQSHNRTLVHILLIVAVSSVWFIPYLTAFVAAMLVYEHGIKIMLTLFVFSTSVVCLTPLMFTKNNRQSVRVYFNYFFTRIQAQETRQQIIKRLPLLQALFFSSVVIFFGFGVVYSAYYYDLIDREFRNSCLKTILSVAISWFIFSLCRSFERFFKDWLWILMSVALSHVLDPHLNPSCRNEVVMGSMVISQVVRLLVPRFVQFRFFNGIISATLPRLQVVSSRLRIPLPYQIYEHHSLQHLVHLDTITSTIGTTSSVGVGVDASQLLHTSTSTGDLLMRRSGSSRPSIASINEIQPLVDYIDEVLEGSVVEEGFGEMGLTDLGEGYLDYSYDTAVDGADDFERGGAEGYGEGHTAGELLYLMGEAENADCEARNSIGGAGSGTGSNGVVGSVLPLWEQLRGQLEAEEGNREAPSGNVEESNRAALLQHEQFSLEGIPLYTTSTSGSTCINSNTDNVASTSATTTEHVTLSSSGGSVDAGSDKKAARRSTRNKTAIVNTNTGSTNTNNNTDHTNTTTSSTTPTQHNPLPLHSHLIGATVLPLSLVGPVRVVRTNSGSGTSGSGTSGGSISGAGKKGKKSVNMQNTNTNTNVGSNTTGVTAAKVWYPLTTHNAALVSGMQSVCSGLVGSVECTLHTPLQDTLTFSSTLHTTAPNNSTGGVSVGEWLQWSAQYLPHLLRSAVATDPTASILLRTLHTPHTVHSTRVTFDINNVCSVKCTPQGRTAVLQLSVSTTTGCNILTLLSVGKGLLRRILKAIQEDYVHLHTDSVLVNYTHLLHIDTLTPYMQYSSVSVVLTVPTHTVALLINTHCSIDIYDANVHIKSTLHALLTSIGVDTKYADVCSDLCSDVCIKQYVGSGTDTIDISTGDNTATSSVVVSARVPVVLSLHELRMSADSAAALTCRSLLCGGGSGDVVSSVSALVVLSYVAHVLTSTSTAVPTPRIRIL